MPFKIANKVTGLEGLLKTLDGLKQGTVNGILRPAIRGGSAIIAKAAKENIRPRADRTGQMRRSIGAVVRTGRRGGSVYGVIGPRHGFRIPVGVRKRGKNKGDVVYHDPAKVGHLVEKGHGGKSPAPPHPFMRPAIDATRGAVVSEMREKIRAGLAKYAARRGR